jgi:hypothetical protein
MSDINSYGSHIRILEELLFLMKSKNSVLEFGPGSGENSSTQLFLDNFKSCTSVEMNSQEWHEKTKHSGSIFCPGMFEFLNLDLGRFDLIFVDGHADSRYAQVNYATDHSDLVVIHDTEEEMYKWEQVKIPEGWTWIDIVNFRPWTSILTKNQEIIDGIKDKFNCVINGEAIINSWEDDSIIWITKYGPVAFNKYNPEWRAHLELLKYKIKSKWFCYFPKSESHKIAELTKNSRVIDLNKTSA